MTDISVIGQAEIPFIPLAEELWENPPVSDTDQTFPQRLQEAIDAKGISPRALSLAIGANHAYISQLLSGKGGSPSSARLARIAEVLDTSVDALSGLAPAGGFHSEVSVRDVRQDWRGERGLPGIPLVGTGDCAELTVTDAATGKEIAVERSSFDPEFHVRYVRRPAALADAKDIYAIYFHGSSMEPRYYAGETGLVNPRRPAGPGDYVLVQLNNGESDEVTSAMVKRLVRQSTKEYVLEQHNPPLTFTIPRTRVARVHRLIPPSELLD